MSICKFKKFSGDYTPGPLLTGEGKREERKRGRIGDEGYRAMEWDKEEGVKGKGREGGKHTPRFSPTPPSFDLSGSKPALRVAD
jgi:hypothetical protein